MDFTTLSCFCWVTHSQCNFIDICHFCIDICHFCPTATFCSLHFCLFVSSSSTHSLRTSSHRIVPYCTDWQPRQCSCLLSVTAAPILTVLKPRHTSRRLRYGRVRYTVHNILHTHSHSHTHPHYPVFRHLYFTLLCEARSILYTASMVVSMPTTAMPSHDRIL